jgi:AmiR/NasT family two-component response regulator
MSQSKLRVAITDADASSREQLQSVVVEAGHQVVLSAASPNELLGHREIDNADILIADVNAVDSGGIDSIAEVLRRHEAPVIVTSNDSSDESLQLAQACRPFAHLVKPVTKDALKVAISLAAQRFEEFRTLRAEAASLSHALEERKVVEKAKGVLMRRDGVDEAEAFLRLQRIARGNRIRLVEAAKAVLVSEKAFQ